MAAKYEIFENKGGQTHFNLKAANGRVILTSQRYKRRSGTDKGIEAVRKNCGDDRCYERRESKAGEPYFVLKATNGQVIGTSQMYGSAAACERHAPLSIILWPPGNCMISRPSGRFWQKCRCN